MTFYWNKPAFPFPRFAKTPLTKPFHFPFHFFPPTSNSICLATCFDHFQPMKFSLPKLKGYWADLSFPARFSPVCCSTPGRQNKNKLGKIKRTSQNFGNQTGAVLRALTKHRENVCDQVATGIRFASDWLRRRRKFYRPIKRQKKKQS